MSPFKQLVLWAIDAPEGRVLHRIYHHYGIAIDCPPPIQNAPFGTRHPLLVCVDGFVVPTEHGRHRARAWQ